MTLFVTYYVVFSWWVNHVGTKCIYVKTPRNFDDNKILNEQLVVVKIDLCRIISKKLFAL
jgi:hypothetical protein